jgi:HAMP domain-containing protein
VVVGVAFFAAMILFMQAGINAAKRSLERSATQPKATEPAPTTSPAEHR